MGCLAIQIILNRLPWAHHGIESHIFAPEAIKGDVPLVREWDPRNLDEKSWWKTISTHCWELDPTARCTAKKLLEDGIKMVTLQMDPFLMGRILTKACTAAGRKNISEFVLEREYGLHKDALCVEVIEAAAKHNKSFANWKLFTLAIQTKDEEKEPQRLNPWTDRPFEIFEKWDPKEKPRFVFKIVKEKSLFEPEPRCGVEEMDKYSTVLTRVLDAHGVDGDRSEYILFIKCGDNGEEVWISKNCYPWYKFKQLEEDRRSPRFSFFRESARPIDTPSHHIIRNFSEDGNRDYAITRMVQRASEFMDSTVSLETGIFAISVLASKAEEEIKIDSCYKVEKDEGDTFVGRLLQATRSECLISLRPTECPWKGFLRLKVHPLIALSDSQHPSPSPPKRTFFKTYLPLKLEYLDEKELKNHIIYVAREKYKPTRDYEVRLRPGDEVMSFRTFNHWRYVIKVADGERGWIPSWKIVEKSSPTPATTEDPSKESTDTAKDEKPSESTSS
ncbi:hypothetical protein FRC03_006137 [Tulasnella sp. 419]|nr:hypothetical protein FRC03_006137 [Tulasnella sp. 419]